MKPFSKMNRQNTALLVIDVINSCAAEGCEIPEWNIHFTKIRKMIPRLKKFIAEFRNIIGGPVIFGKTVPWQREFLADNVNELYENEKFAYFTKDKSGFAEKSYLLQQEENDIIAEKNTNDAFTSPEFIEELIRRNIKYIVTTGIFTDGCVLATVVGGFSKGYNFIVLKDLVETTDVKKRQEIQKHLLEFTFPYMFARVTTSEALLKDWIT